MHENPHIILLKATRERDIILHHILQVLIRLLDTLFIHLQCNLFPHSSFICQWEKTSRILKDDELFHNARMRRNDTVHLFDCWPNFRHEFFIADNWFRSGDE